MTETEALAALGATPEAVAHVRTAPTIRDARARLDALKLRTRRAFRGLAKRHHPDHGGDPEAFRALKAAHDRIQSAIFTPAINNPEPSLWPITAPPAGLGPEAWARYWHRT